MIRRALFVPTVLGGVRYGDEQTLSLQPDAAAGIDSYISHAAATTNYGTNNTILIGEHNAAALIARGLIEFDISSIPSGSLITSAVLSLYLYGNAADNDGTLAVYRLLRDWAEGEVTYNIYSTGNNWQTAGGFGALDCEQTDIGNVAVVAAASTGFVDVTLTNSAVQQMITGGAFTNNGFLLKMTTELNNAHSYRSSDWTTAGERPKFVVKYRAPL